MSRALRAYALQGIGVSVESGVVTLSGNVDRCLIRLDALQLTSRIRGVRAMADRLQVAGPRVPDEHLMPNAPAGWAGTASDQSRCGCATAW